MVSVLREGYRIPFRDLLPPPRQVAGIVPNVPARLSAGSRPPSGSREHDNEESPGDRTRSGSRLLQPPLSSRKGIRRLETRDRPLPPQRIRPTNPVQDGDHRLSTPLGQKGRLPSLREPERHVLPDPHPPLVQEVAPFRHGRDGPSAQGTLLRTVNHPAGLHESFRNSVSLGPLPRSSTSPVSGRLVGPGLGDQSQAACPRTTLALSLPRHSDKRREVRPQPIPVCGVPRYVHRHSGRPSLPHSSERRKIPLDSQTVLVMPEPSRPALTGVVGTHVIAGEAGSPRETQDALDTVAPKVPLVPREGSPPPPGTPVLAGQGGSLLVGGEGPPPQGDELRNTDSGHPPLFGRVPVRVGSSPPRSISVGDMVGPGELAAHQSA